MLYKCNVLGENTLGAPNRQKPIVKVMIWEGLGLGWGGVHPLGPIRLHNKEIIAFVMGFGGVCVPDVFSPRTLVFIRGFGV